MQNAAMRWVELLSGRVDFGNVDRMDSEGELVRFVREGSGPENALEFALPGIEEVSSKRSERSLSLHYRNPAGVARDHTVQFRTVAGRDRAYSELKRNLSSFGERTLSAGRVRCAVSCLCFAGIVATTTAKLLRHPRSSEAADAGSLGDSADILSVPDFWSTESGVLLITGSFVVWSLVTLVALLRRPPAWTVLRQTTQHSPGVSEPRVSTERDGYRP